MDIFTENQRRPNAFERPERQRVLIRVDSLVPAYSTFSLAHKECSFMFISFESIFKEAWESGIWNPRRFAT